MTKAILAGETFNTIPEANLRDAGFTGVNSTAKQSIHTWVETFHRTFGCHPHAAWVGYTPKAIPKDAAA